ncbi:MAG: NINE protein [Bacteroidia bacterium]
MKFFTTAIVFLFFANAHSFEKNDFIEQNALEYSEDYPPIKKWQKVFLNGEKENSRLVAAGLALALGPFGVHRLYLGTDFKVPIVYSLTFGCFFILPTIDFFVILFSKDIEKYKNNKRVIMWLPDSKND